MPSPAPVLSSTAAATWPTLVRTCRVSDRGLRSTVASDCTIIPWGGTEIPLSVVCCSGPASVKMSTSASAVSPLVFIR